MSELINAAESLEMQMRRAESALEKYGAVPTDINRRNREALGQRQTYQHGNTYYRVDQAVFDGKSFVIISCIDIEKYAKIGLMEDVEAIPAEASEAEIRRAVRRVMSLEEDR